MSFKRNKNTYFEFFMASIQANAISTYSPISFYPHMYISPSCSFQDSIELFNSKLHNIIAISKEIELFFWVQSIYVLTLDGGWFISDVYLKFDVQEFSPCLEDQLDVNFNFEGHSLIPKSYRRHAKIIPILSVKNFSPTKFYIVFIFFKS